MFCSSNWPVVFCGRAKHNFPLCLKFPQDIDLLLFRRSHVMWSLHTGDRQSEWHWKSDWNQVLLPTSWEKKRHQQKTLSVAPSQESWLNNSESFPLWLLTAGLLSVWLLGFEDTLKNWKPMLQTEMSGNRNCECFLHEASLSMEIQH